MKMGDMEQQIEAYNKQQLYFIGEPSTPQQVIALRPLKRIKLCFEAIIIWVHQNQFEALSFLKNIPASNQIKITEERRLQSKVQQQRLKNDQTKFIIFCSSLLSLTNLSAYRWENTQIMFYFFNFTDSISQATEFKNKSWNILVKNQIMDLQGFRKSLLQHNTLPNFIPLAQKKKVNNLKATLQAMAKHHLLHQRQLIELFKKIMIQSNYDEQDVDSTFIKYENKQIDIVQLYKAQSIFYQFFNKFLRKMRDPCILFYAQPFVNSLFCKINQMYKKQKHSNLQIFYRGGLLSEQQIYYFQKNINKFIFSLGFMSASRDRDIAQKIFMINALIIIKVPKEKRAQQTDFGYAILQNDENEKQVIFNMLNSFRIQKITQTQGNNVILQLVYGQLSKVTQKINQQKQLDESQIKIEVICKYQKIITEVKNQDDIFISCSQPSQATQYWMSKIKYISGKASPKSVSFAKIQLIKTRLLSKKYEVALKQINQLISQIDNEAEFGTQIFKLKKMRGQAYMGLRRYQQSKSSYQQALIIPLANQCRNKFMIQLYESLSFANLQIGNSNTAKENSSKAFKYAMDQYKPNQIEYEIHRIKYLSMNQQMPDIILSKIKSFLPKMQSIEGCNTYDFFFILLTSTMLQIQNYFPTTKQFQLQIHQFNEQSQYYSESEGDKIRQIQEKLQKIQILYQHLQNICSIQQKAECFYMIALILKKLLKYKQAVYAFQKSLSYFQQLQEMYQQQCAQIHAQIAIGLQSDKKTQLDQSCSLQVIEHLQKSVSLFQKHMPLTKQNVATFVLSLFRLGKLYKQKDIDKSMQYFNKVFQIKPQLKTQKKYSRLYMTIQQYENNNYVKLKNNSSKEVSQISKNESTQCSFVAQSVIESIKQQKLEAALQDNGVQNPKQTNIKIQFQNKQQQLQEQNRINIGHSIIKLQIDASNTNSQIKDKIDKQNQNPTNQQQQSYKLNQNKDMRQCNNISNLFNDTTIENSIQNYSQNQQGEDQFHENIFTPQWICEHLYSKQDALLKILELKQCALDCIDKKQYQNALVFANKCLETINEEQNGSINIQLVQTICKVQAKIKQQVANLK